MINQTKNVFISHIHEDDDGLNRLKDLLSNHGIEARDYSIRSDNPNRAKSEDYIKQDILGPRIRQCSTLLVYISDKTKDSDYVNWEIEYAQRNDKRIVGIWAYGEKGCPIPEALRKFGDALVGWTGDRIVDAINGKINRWEECDGTQIPPRSIPREGCR